MHTDDAWALAAARLRAKLRGQKHSIRIADFWIASWAELHDTFVITKNVKDYKAMGVKARTW